MESDDVIGEIEGIINTAIWQLGYQVTARPMEVPEDKRIFYDISVRLGEPEGQGNESFVAEAIRAAIPDLQYKGHTLDVSVSGHSLRPLKKI